MSHKVILHIDMDAFFAAVEQRDNPTLKGKPVIIGADPKQGKGRGVVSTCSYEARPFGVRSAMSISEAYRRCPQGVFLRGSHQKYREVSREVMAILSDFTPDIQPISIDEAFLDITGSFHFYKTPLGTGQEIRRRIKEKTQLNASIGIAPVKFVAKIASDHCKPDGLLEIKQDEVLDFLHPLPIRSLWGVGPKSQKKLNAFGVQTIGDIAAMSESVLAKEMGEHGLHLYALANGIDERGVRVDDEVKSVSHEHTFESDVNEREEIRHTILFLCEKVSRRLRRYEVKGKTISMKLRLAGYETYTRAVTLNHATNLVDDIYTAAMNLFNDFHEESQEFRLVGVRVSHFVDDAVQDDLFAVHSYDKKEGIHKAMDRIKDKFGDGAIHRGL